MYAEKLQIDARNNLVILDDRGWHDLQVDEFLAEELKKAGCDKKLHVLVQVNLVVETFELLCQRFPSFSSDNGLCVFPGRSAVLVRKQAERQVFYGGPILDRNTFVSVHASRRFDGFGNPVVTVGQILPLRVVSPEIQTVVVVDDVISSGVTCRTLYERNAHKFPRAVWYVSACVSRQENIKGYKEVVSPRLIPPDAKGLKVPINSLTTLMEEKDIGEQYAAKHCTHPGIFLAALATVKLKYCCDPNRMDMHIE